MDNLIVEGEITMPPTDDDVKIVEHTLGITFPPSYNKFVKKYGAGLLCGLFLIHVPNSTDEDVDLVRKHRFEKETTKELVEAGFWDRLVTDKDWLLSLFPFGSSENGDILCWDLNQKDENGEYPIYLLDNEQSAAPLVAHSMDEFVEEFCINQKIDDIYPMGQGERWNLPARFESFGQSEQTAPSFEEDSVDNPYKYPSVSLFIKGKMVECFPHKDEGIMYVKLKMNEVSNEVLKELRSAANEWVGTDRLKLITNDGYKEL
jgi:hypothetical protein